MILKLQELRETNQKFLELPRLLKELVEQVALQRKSGERQRLERTAGAHVYLVVSAASRF